MHNLLKSSTDWKQVEKKFKEENNTKIESNIEREKKKWIYNQVISCLCVGVCILFPNTLKSGTKSKTNTISK